MTIEISKKKINLLRLRKSLLVTFLSVGLCYFFYYILDINVFDYLSKQDNEADVVNYFYKIENRSSKEKSYNCYYDDKIVIFDLKGTKSRTTIADAIEGIAQNAPQAIILDIIFPAVSQSDFNADTHLLEVISKYNDIIVTASRLTDNVLERSFYIDATNVKEGLVNKANYCLPYEIFQGDTLQYMPYAAIGISKGPNAGHLVNYFDKEFLKVSIQDDLVREEIEGKIVLIGDLNDWRDSHDMPFRVNGSYRVSGTVLMAHLFSTILNDLWIIRINDFWALLLAIVVVFAFILFCYWLRDNQNIAEEWRGFLEGSSRLLLIIVLMFGTYWLFSIAGVLLNLVYSMLALAMTGLSMEIVGLGDWWIRSKDNRKQNSERKKTTLASAMESNEGLKCDDNDVIN